jgi:predicted RNA binding protein YcfA (HicA-like mRNA interferase family)
MTFRDVRRLIREDGWFLVRQEGSHEQYRHATKVGRVTIAGQDGRDVPMGTLRSILKQAGLR